MKMRYNYLDNYYYPYSDTVAEFQDYSNEWDCDPEYDYVDDNPVDLIDDLKEEYFIKEAKQGRYRGGW